MTTAAEPATNPLLAPWAGPYGGVPPFDRARVADFEPALEAGMADQLARTRSVYCSQASRCCSGVRPDRSRAS